MKKQHDSDIFNKERGTKRWKIVNDVEIVEDIHFVKEQKELVAIVRNG